MSKRNNRMKFNPAKGGTLPTGKPNRFRTTAAPRKRGKGVTR
jgi:hypothetical protein